MESPVAITIHPSRFPAATRAAYLESFRTRRMNHQFHYESEKQAQQWLALHEAYSPARTDDDCLQTYQRAFAASAKLIAESEIALVSIGCGGGQKDLALLRELRARRVNYVPSDVSLALALIAHQRVTAELRLESKPLLLDLPRAADFSGFLDSFLPGDAGRVLAFFGMLPNFEADALRPLFAALRANDIVIASANLAPGSDYRAGVEKILPLYDNELTRHWLATSLIDAGLEISPRDIVFSIRAVGNLLRIEANYTFQRAQTIRIDANEFAYAASDVFQLFFSYRYTPALLRELFASYRVEIVDEWITASGEEGIFLCRKSG